MTDKTDIEMEAQDELAWAFHANNNPRTNLENFPKYVNRQDLKRFIVRYELFKQIQNVKGSIIECGVFHGFGLMSWYHCSTMLEPENFQRKIFGFDTFKGFIHLDKVDRADSSQAKIGNFCSDSKDELEHLVRTHDRNRFLGHIEKVELYEGDAIETIPQFLKDHREVVIALLFLDFDLFLPTKVALELLVERMPKGAIIAFDELNNSRWPGETAALKQVIGIKELQLQQFPWDPNVSFAVL